MFECQCQKKIVFTFFAVLHPRRKLFRTRVSKTEGFFEFTSSAATFSHEMKFECSKLRALCFSLVGPAASLLHETRFECQKLGASCEFSALAATISHNTRFECQKLKFVLRVWFSHATRFERQKLRVSCEFGWSGGNPFARNEVRVLKTKGLCAKASVCKKVCV